jgi:hypothetical protein
MNKTISSTLSVKPFLIGDLSDEKRTWIAGVVDKALISAGVDMAALTKIMTDERDTVNLDAYLSAGALENKYSPDGNGTHPIYSLDMWHVEVSRKHTLFGYWDWVENQIHSEKIVPLKVSNNR